METYNNVGEAWNEILDCHIILSHYHTFASIPCVSNFIWHSNQLLPIFIKICIFSRIMLIVHRLNSKLNGVIIICKVNIEY